MYVHVDAIFVIFFLYKCFDQMWLNQLPWSNGFTSRPKDAVINTFSFLRVELSKLIGERKSLTLVGLEPATFRLQASTLTSRPLEPPKYYNT